MNIDNITYEYYHSMSGVYKIYSLIDNRCYIGSSNNLYGRLRRHYYSLVNKKHKNLKLQNFVNKYGIDKLEITIIKQVRVEELEEVETYFIEKYNSYLTGFNCTNNGSNCRGIKRSKEIKEKLSKVHIGKRLSQCTKDRIRNTLSGRKQTKEHISNMLTGKRKNGGVGSPGKRSEESIIRMSKAKTGKISKKRSLNTRQVLVIKELLKNKITHKIIAELLGTTRDIIKKISQGKAYIN